MKIEKTFLWHKWTLLIHSKLEDVTICRISPRSYYNGQRTGIGIGLGIGFMVGFLLMSLVMANL